VSQKKEGMHVDISSWNRLGAQSAVPVSIIDSHCSSSSHLSSIAFGAAFELSDSAFDGIRVNALMMKVQFAYTIFEFKDGKIMFTRLFHRNVAQPALTIIAE
jgi:hypothetical protein